MLPILSHHRAHPTDAERRLVERVADALRDECPELSLEDVLQALVMRGQEHGVTLHVDDISEIPLFSGGAETCFVQERARLRAMEGDLVVSTSPAAGLFEGYFRDRLQLGSVDWLRPHAPHDPQRVAAACWEDRATRRTLVHAMRQGGLRYLHPHIGSLAVWELALLLQRASHRPLEVIAPPPGLTRWVNNKLAFAGTIRRLFGERYLPRTAEAGNFALLADRVRELSDEAAVIGIKLPDSAGGGGNRVVEAERFRGRGLAEIRSMLELLLAPLAWEGSTPLVVSSWETHLLSTPSVQIWIPPAGGGEPIVEGVFEQTLEGCTGVFVGSRPARLPVGLTVELVDRCWLVALLYQILGYVGRCSFDMLLVGDSLDAARVEFIECNGRWGGTSAPMTLMNRLFGDWTRQPYVTRVIERPDLQRIAPEGLIEELDGVLYDARTGEGWLVLYNLGRIAARSGVAAIVLGRTLDEAAHRMQHDLPERLARLAAGR